MKIYNALIKKNQSGKIEDIILLKEGFSFTAFLFSGLWFLYHKMWCEFLALLLINIAFGFLDDFLSDSDKIILQISYIFIVALNANYWLCENLKKKNYQLAGVVFGQNEVEAKLRFIDKFEKSSEFDNTIFNPKSFAI